MNFTTLHPPLIADPDPAFLQYLIEDTGATLAPPITVATAKALKDQLNHGRYVFSGIFLNPQIAGGDTYSILSHIRRTRPSTPLYLISDVPYLPLTPQQLRAITVHEALPKPFAYMQVLKRVTSAQTPGSQPSIASDGSLKGAPVEVAGRESEFMQILSSQFLPGAASHFDLYIRLNENRFVKILRDGDALTVERLEFYQKKGIEHFYVREDAHEIFLRHCREVLAHLIRDPNREANEKAELALKHGSQVMAFLQAHRVSPAAIQLARDFVDNVVELTFRLRLDQAAEIRKQLMDPNFRDHASACTIISTLLGSRLGLKGEKAVSLIGAASFLHDIGLPSMELKYLDGDEELMTKEELDLYRGHPLVGAGMLRKVPELEPIAIQAIEQHHERRDRKGFPNQLGAGQISMVSEVVGISDELMHLISSCSRLGNRDPIREMEMNGFNGFSTTVIEAFRKCFGPS